MGSVASPPSPNPIPSSVALPPSPNPIPSSAKCCPWGVGRSMAKAVMAQCPFTPIPKPTAPQQGRGKEKGEKGDMKQRGARGAKGGEQEKQDDRTLAPQPSAKLQTSLLRWKAAVS